MINTNQFDNFIKNISTKLEENMLYDLIYEYRCKINSKDIPCLNCSIDHNIDYFICHVTINMEDFSHLNLKIGDTIKVEFDFNNLYKPLDKKQKLWEKDNTLTLDKFLLYSTYNFANNMVLILTHQVIYLNNLHNQVFVKQKPNDIVKQVCENINIDCKTNISGAEIPVIVQYNISHIQFLNYFKYHYSCTINTYDNGTMGVSTLDSLSKSETITPQYKIIKMFDMLAERQLCGIGFDLQNPSKPKEILYGNDKKPWKDDIIFHHSKILEKNNIDAHKHYEEHWKTRKEFHLLIHENLSLFSKIQIEINDKKETVYIVQKIMNSDKFFAKPNEKNYLFRYVAISGLQNFVSNYKIETFIPAIVDQSIKKDNKLPVDEFGNFPVYLFFDKDKKSFMARNCQIIANEKGGSFFPYREGDEVLIGFVEGLPTCPFIFGSETNKKTPYVSKDSNEHGLIIPQIKGKKDLKLIINPTDDKEVFELQFIKNYHLHDYDKVFEQQFTIEDKKSTVKHYIKEGEFKCEYEKVKMNFDLKDGDVAINLKKGKLDLSIGTDGLTIKSKDDIKISCDKDIQLESKGDFSIKALKNINLEATKDLCIKAKALKQDTTDDIEIKTPKDINISGNNVTVKSIAKLDMESSGSSTYKASSITIDGTTTMSKPVTMNSAVTINSALTVNSAVTINAALTVSGAATIGAALTVGAATTIGATLTVSAVITAPFFAGQAATAISLG